jgi:RNase P/RNase MRP subunit p29
MTKNTPVTMADLSGQVVVEKWKKVFEVQHPPALLQGERLPDSCFERVPSLAAAAPFELDGFASLNAELVPRTDGVLELSGPQGRILVWRVAGGLLVETQHFGSAFPIVGARRERLHDAPR